MKIFEAVANALHEESVSVIFGLMGDGNLRFLNYWTKGLGQDYYGTRHEATAVAMADGYARATGAVGVCTVTQGPGVTNAVTALITARKAGSRVLILTGDVAATQQGWPQDIDQDAVFAAAGVPFLHIESPETPFRDVVAAYRLAQRTGGPVGVDLPVDLQELDWVPWEDGAPDAEPPGTPETDLSGLRRAAELLTRARKPVVIAGRGVVESGAEPELRRIGDRIGALFATTLRGKGLFAGDPHHLGIAGGLGTNLAAKLLGEADAALVVGAAMNDFTTMRQSLLRSSVDLVRCDLLPRENVATSGEHCLLTGDAAAVLPLLLEQIESIGPGGDGYRTPPLRAELAAFTPQSELALVEGDEFLDPRSLAIALNRALPEDRVVVTDAGHFFGNPCTYVDVTDARSFICGIDFGSIGLGLGHAMGAAVAHGGRPVALFVGDGGLQMSMGDLETAVRYRMPLVVVVMNDAAYGSELQIMRLWNLPEDLSVFPPTDFAAVAAALGARAARITSLDQVAGAVPPLDEGPVVLDCAVTRKVRAAWLDEAFSR